MSAAIGSHLNSLAAAGKGLMPAVAVVGLMPAVAVVGLMPAVAVVGLMPAAAAVGHDWVHYCCWQGTHASSGCPGP